MKYLSASAIFLLIVVLAALTGFGQGNQIDPTFHAVPSQASAPPGQPGGLTVQPDGKIIVWGGSSSFGQIARLNDDGTIDSSFNYCGCGTSTVTSVVLRADGKLVVGGTGTDLGAKVVLVNADGALDTAFQTSFPPGSFSGGGGATVLAVQSDNRVLVHTVYSFQGASSYAIYRLNADGSQDGAFNVISFGPPSHGFYASPTATRILPDGRIILALQFSGGLSIWSEVRRYNSDGTPDTSWSAPTFAPSDFNTVRGLAIQSDGDVIVGGVFDHVNGLARNCYARLFPAGNVDLSFAPTGFVAGELNSGQVGFTHAGKLLVTGKKAPITVPKIFRLNPDGTPDDLFVFDPSIRSVDVPWVIDPFDRIILYGTAQGGLHRFLRLNSDGSIDGSFNPMVSLPGAVYSSVRQPDGRIVIAGSFYQVNGVVRPTIARVNIDGSTDESFDPGSGFSGTLSPIALSLQPDGKILAVGAFTSYNGIPRAGLARIDTDGGLDAAYQPSFSSTPVAIAVQLDGRVIAVGGFSTVNGINRALIARLNNDGGLDETFTPMVGGTLVQSVAIQSDGGIVFGGSFSGVNGFNRANLARVNQDGSLDESFNAGAIGGPYHIWLQPDNKALLGYSTTLIRRNVNGTADNSFATPTFSGNSPKIDSVVIQNDGSIVVGGSFSSVGTATRNNFVRLSRFGVVDRFFFLNGANGEVFTLTGQPDGKIVVGGSFTRFENDARAGIVRVNTAPYHAIVPFDFDGDGRADISVTRTGGSYVWYQLLGSSYIFSQATFGQTGDVVTPSDFDGDGTTDIAIFRGGDWWWRSSINGQQQSAHWGAAGDIPLPGDIDGDGRTDFVVYRNGTWYRVVNGSTTTLNVDFGAAGDKPLLADFDGDGKADPAIFRPSTGTFWYAASSAAGAHRATQWGIATDVPVPADYDGDGKTDFAVYRPAEGAWYVLRSSNGGLLALQFGVAEDRPIPADYDGDGQTDIAVFRPSTGIWYLLQSTAGFQGFQWGISTDIPSPAAYIPQ